jgi:multidrug efflux system membrane fusion protein
VQLGATDGDRVEVRSGLAPGDRIVIDGADKLRDGAKVVVRPPTDANRPADTGKGRDQDKSGGGKKQRSEGGQKQ